MAKFFRRIWFEDQGQDIAEYAVMLAVILVLVVGTIRLIGTMPITPSPRPRARSNSRHHIALRNRTILFRGC
jgi:Flp pilus assembly pilin Flp